MCKGVQKMHRRCTKVHGWLPWVTVEWVGGVGGVGAGLVHKETRKQMKIFEMCACFDRAYHEKST